MVYQDPDSQLARLAVAATLMEKAYKNLRTKFELGELPPGAQLVNRTLCKEFGVSTIPLREAIQRLASEGFVEHIPNAGAFVRRIDRREVIQLFELRGALELFSVEQAAARIDADQLDQLDDICAKWRRMVHALRDRANQSLRADEYRNWINHDVQFHCILVEASGNIWLKQTIDQMQLMSRVAVSKPARMELPRATKNYRTHSGIVRGLRKRDLALASYWMTRHNDFAMEVLKLAFADE
jgi:DNA-binding GntR family transcriptional regulator